MKPNTIHKNVLSYGNLPSKFLLLTIVALTVYVCISFVASTSVFSVKVDMFIKMQNVQDRFFNMSNKNKSDGLDSIPMYESAREHGERRVYLDKKPPNYTEGVQEIRFKKNTNGADYSNLDSITIDMIDQQRSTVDGKLSKADSFLSETVRFQNSRYTQKNNTVLSNQEFTKSVNNVNIRLNNLDEDYAYEPKRENGPSGVDILGNSVGGLDRKRKETCTGCFQHNFQYVIENDVCKIHNGEDVELLILIATSSNNNKARTALRNTWLSFTKRNTAHIRYAFLLGETNDQKQRQSILVEDNSFHDIIKEDFVDSYKNLTYKTIMGFKWASSKCAHARYVMKTDDDMFVNIPNLINIIRGHVGDALHHAVAGACRLKAKPIRNNSSKWFASLQSYPQQTYPGFCSGTGYITSMKVVTKIYQVSPNVPFFHLEDVYVALCLKRLGFSLRMLYGFNTGRPKLDPCLYKGRRLITAHQMSPTMLTIIWKRQCLRLSVKV